MNTKQRFGRHDVVYELPASTDQGEDALRDNAKLGARLCVRPVGSRHEPAVWSERVSFGVRRQRMTKA